MLGCIFGLVALYPTLLKDDGIFRKQGRCSLRVAPTQGRVERVYGCGSAASRRWQSGWRGALAGRLMRRRRVCGRNECRNTD